jgi:hypothetical protein
MRCQKGERPSALRVLAELGILAEAADGPRGQPDGARTRCSWLIEAPPGNQTSDAACCTLVARSSAQHPHMTAFNLVRALSTNSN